MRKLFLRNSPETVKDALELSMEEFVAKYKPTTSTDEILSKAYLEIRAKHKPPEPKVEQPLEKRVTFKVVKKEDGKPEAHITLPDVDPEDELSHEQQIEQDMMVAANEVDMNNLHCNGKEIVEPTAEPEEKKAKSKRGKKPDPNAGKRDERILELLKEGKKGVEIIKIMKEEGYSVHAPQISNLKAIHEL